MAELIVEPIQTAELESSGYIGQPEGNIDLTENNVQVNVAPYKYATPKIPIQEDVPAVNPSTQEQTIDPDEGFAGMDRVVVNPANLEIKRVAPKAEEQTIVPQSPAIGFLKIIVDGVVPSLPIDPDSLTPIELGVDSKGFYYTDEVGGGTPIYFGRDSGGLYVTDGGNENE